MSKQTDTTTEHAEESVDSPDAPLGEQAPGAPFAVAGLTYPLVLSVVLAAVALYFFALR